MPNKNNESIMKADDLIFSKNSGGKFTGGGFCINSHFLKNMNENGVISPITTLNILGGKHDDDEDDEEDDEEEDDEDDEEEDDEDDEEDDEEDKDNKSCNVINFNSDVNFKSIVVPLGLFYKKEKMINSSLGKFKKENDIYDDNEISDAIYDELLNMVSVKNEKSGNDRNNKNNQTVKNKNKNKPKTTKNKSVKNTSAKIAKK
jgi:hypothetical protein